jgi:hypothetical protein
VLVRAAVDAARKLNLELGCQARGEAAFRTSRGPATGAPTIAPKSVAAATA